MRVKLEDVCERGTSSLMQKDIVDKNGKYPVYGASGRIGSMETYQQEHQTVAVVKDGAGIGRTMLLPEKSSVIGTMQYLIPKNCIESEYLYYVVKYMHLEKYFSGATIPHIYFRDYKTEEFNLHDKTEQREIVSTLKRIEAIISNRQEQLTKLDELIKARFVEMFGDPLNNEKNWNTSTLAEMCDGIGDGLHGTPEYDESGEYPFINGNNLIDGAIRVNALTKRVNKATYEKHYIEISQNAILLSINGTLGKIAFFNGEQVMLGKSACYCNLKVEVNRIFVYNIMKTDAFARYLEDNSTKSTIKNVGLKAIREYRLILPPLSLQKQFAAFVEEVDKSKLFVGSAAAHKPFDIGFFSQKHCATPCKRGIISSKHMIFH